MINETTLIGKKCEGKKVYFIGSQGLNYYYHTLTVELVPLARGLSLRPWAIM